MMPQWHQKLPLDLITNASMTNGLDPFLVASIVMTESGGYSWRPRYEPMYQYLYYPREIAKVAGVSLDTMIMIQKTSWGLMQVMGAVAYERGLPHDQVPTQLCLPHVGLEYGCKHLKKYLDKYGSEEDAVSAYNQGSARMANGQYLNFRYVDKVYSYLRELRRIS